MLLDPDLVADRKQQAKDATANRKKTVRHPPLFGWSAEMSLLADIADIAYKQATGNPRAALPRPLTATDYISHARRQSRMDQLIKRFSPRHVGLTPQIDL